MTLQQSTLSINTQCDRKAGKTEMKKTFLFCEWCGKIFDNEHEAKQCERSHLIPLNVNPTFYTEGAEIPELVKVDFGTEEVIYRRIKKVKI